MSTGTGRRRGRCRKQLAITAHRPLSVLVGAALLAAIAVPAGWEQIRDDRLQTANIVREIAVVAGLMLLLVAGLRRRPTG